MLLAVFVIGVVGSSLTEKYSDYFPAQPGVLEYSHSAKITIDPKDVPAGTDRVHIEAKEINDLTGDRFEQGYSYGYNSAVPYFYYPQLNAGKYHVFKLQYGRSSARSGAEFSQLSVETSFLHSDSSRFSMDIITRNWPMARDQCIIEKKRLAVIHGQKSNDMVQKLLVANREKLRELGGRAWIGLYDTHYNDDSPTTTWSWVDHTPFKFSYFEYGARVSQSELSSAVVAINIEGEWETVSPDEKLPFICETGVTEKPKETEARVGLSQAEIA